MKISYAAVLVLAVSLSFSSAEFLRAEMDYNENPEALGHPVHASKYSNKQPPFPAKPTPSKPTPEKPTGGIVGVPTATKEGSGWQAEMLKAVNAERAKQGLKPLCLNSKLTRAAGNHAADMASKHYFSHTSQDGRSPFDRIKATGFKDGTAAENIALGQTDVADVMKSWMNSPGHRANILGSGYAMAGFGMSSNNWVQDFGGPNGEQCD